MKELPGSRKQICYPYLKNNVCRYGDDCYRLHVPNLDARSDVRPHVKTPITDEMRRQTREALAQQNDESPAKATSNRAADFTAVVTTTRGRTARPDFCMAVDAVEGESTTTASPSACCQMLLPPEPEYVEVVLALRARGVGRQ